MFLSQFELKLGITRSFGRNRVVRKSIKDNRIRDCRLHLPKFIGVPLKAKFMIYRWVIVVM